MKLWRRLVTPLFLVLSELFAYQRPRWLLRARASLLSLAGVDLPSSETFVEKGFRVLSPGKLRIEKHVSLGHDNHFWCFSNVRIGEWTQTAKDLLIISGSHDNSTFEPMAQDGQSVDVGAGCWIGARVTILGGTKIGVGSIVAAGSVVRGEFPAWSVIGGVPARVLKIRTPAAQITSPFGKYHPRDLDPSWRD